MEADLLNQGITLMLVGMGTVFSFLTLLVIAMSLMSAIAIRFGVAKSEGGVTEEEVAAITAAIAVHRRNSE